MPDAEFLVQLDELRRSNRRWKMFALTLSLILGVLLSGTGCFIVYKWHKAREAESRAREELEARKREARKNPRLNDEKAKPDTKQERP
jgi:hypothetical protein